MRSRDVRQNVLNWFGKVCISGCIALGLLSVFSLLYYNNGIRKTSMTGATDYSWENRFWSLGYEGFAAGFFDEDGFNNCEAKSEAVDILLMGSSQMDAYNVSPQYATGYLLQQKLQETELNYNVYNIGMEGHDFFICSDNLDEALETYQPSKYILIETRSARMSIESMNEVINGTRIRTSAYDSGMIYYLQKIPYFRLLHRQIRDMGMLQTNNKTEDEVEDLVALKDNNLSNQEYIQKVDEYMEMLAEKMESSKAELIIFYIPDITINDDGSITTAGTKEDLAMLSQSCQEHDIKFVDLSESFLEHYQDTYEVPFGFSNTEIGTGHLNRTGHALIADKLFETILEMENS